jgi:ketosteroid isomerase-like protein
MATSGTALEQIRLDMARTNQLFIDQVIGQLNFDALDQVYTSDARILPPGALMVSGRPAIKKFWSDLIQAVGAKSASLTSVEVIPAGEHVVEIGRATLGMQPPDQPASELEVKYVVCWTREDGRWKWQVDIWNPNS